MLKGIRALVANAGRRRLVIVGLLALCAYALYVHPPLVAVRRGEVLVRSSAVREEGLADSDRSDDGQVAVRLEEAQ